MNDSVSYELQQIRLILERIASATPVAPDVTASVEGGGGVSDGDKGDITVAGSVWSLNPRSVTAAEFASIGAYKIIGRHEGTDGDFQEIGLDSTLEFSTSNIRRAALTGDVTASAGSNTTTLVTSGVVAGTYGSGSAVPVITVDAKGRITSATVASLSAGITGTVGTTDNALVRADGTGGSTAQGSSVTLDDSGNLSSTNWTVASGAYSGRTYARFGTVASNLALILSPTGTGFISSQVPDGTNTGGNIRGDNAVDFSYSRTAATRVASGTGSFNGGTESTASGANSFAWNASASGSRSIAMAGPATSATATSAIAIGPSMSASAQSATAIGGEGGTASGIYSTVIGGYGSQTSGSFGFSSGYYALASLYGQVAHASGRFASNGDCQSARMEMRAATTNATPTNLFLDGSSARLVVPANSSGCAMITVVARTATAGAETMTWRRRVNWQRGVAVGTVTVDVETVGTDRGYTGGAWGAGPAWTLAITADTTNGAINIIGTGVAATNIRWAASVDWIETTFA